MDEPVISKGKIETFRLVIGGVVLGSVVAAFFLSPLMALANPVLLGSGGIATGIAMFGLYQLAAIPGLERQMSIFAQLFGVLGMILLVFAFQGAFTTSLKRDAMCRKLQTVMIAGYPPGTVTRPGQAEPKDQFQAFGCRLRTSAWF